ncbi:MAG: class I SAM-dependent methyltransferase [Candidatus Kapaibacterium sp.]
MKKKLNPLVSDDSVTTILEIASAYQKSKILLTACELDIFSVLNDGPKTAKELAYQLGTDERATDRLLSALCSMRLLQKGGDVYTNTEGTNRFLVKSQPEYLGDLMHVAHLWDTWGTLTECLRIGTAASFTDINDKSDEWVESYVESIHRQAVLKAPDIVNRINLHGVTRVLDLGGASGLYAMEFVKAKPDIKATVFDLPKVIDQCRKHLDREGFSDKIDTIPGFFLEDDYGKGYDIVFISSIIHLFSIWENIKLLKKAFDCLRRGGRVIIEEELIDDDRIHPTSAAILSLNMLVNTEGGEAYTETDLWIMMREAWFTEVKRVNTEFSTSLMIGSK